jgi:Domain of unknown function (DUF4276)
MTRLYILVEGQTEQKFVTSVLQPSFNGLGLYLKPIIFSSKPGYLGGVTSYAKIKRQIIRLCAQDLEATVTTFIDLYGLPTDFPGKNAPGYAGISAGRLKAQYMQDQLNNDINRRNFFPFIMAHEFEALLFADVSKFSAWTTPPVVASLSATRSKFSTPEDINDSVTTAPSKRILIAMPTYQKTLHGPQIAANIGLNTLTAECPHFQDWIHKLERLVTPAAP